MHIMIQINKRFSIYHYRLPTGSNHPQNPARNVHTCRFLGSLMSLSRLRGKAREMHSIGKLWVSLQGFLFVQHPTSVEHPLGAPLSEVF